jgi:hypothetical protein
MIKEDDEKKRKGNKCRNKWSNIKEKGDVLRKYWR